MNTGHTRRIRCVQRECAGCGRRRRNEPSSHDAGHRRPRRERGGRADHPGRGTGERDLIPALCHLDGLRPVGACRLCLVEIKGSAKLFPACIARIEEGMEVTTNSERLASFRRTVLELLFSERNQVCPVCLSNVNCELQALAQKLGMTFVHFRTRIRSTRWTPRTSGSSRTTTAVCSARGACGCATRSRALTPGTSWAEASTAG